MTPREVFLALVTGVAEGRGPELADLYAERTHVVHPFHPLRPPAIESRDELREHFTPTDESRRLQRTAERIRIHETTDPEVIVAEFEYRGVDTGTGVAFVQPAIFVLRVRDGKIVESRDYFDHLSTARSRGQLDSLLAALEART
ncbi:ketosteroid isomerase [Actinoplanes awajinensis subsp. mycoplanecinus]|uniref:Ketosteroid isomerase n=1 Tax=Actinoplanes awajinensis subsp. mycoplanecinus TaxID=135947 RepID=A0A117MKM1_9ACTN|nr:ketosteroid isomerase [Actinoplanes awajinensis subsp. mycoplanecinus]